MLIIGLFIPLNYYHSSREVSGMSYIIPLTMIVDHNGHNHHCMCLHH